MNLNSKPSALLSLLGVMLLWPYVLTKSVSSSYSLSAGQGEERPHVVKRSTQNCESSYDKYCLNNGQCMLLVDINEHHCKCERGFYGPRCGDPELVFQPLGEEQIIVTIFCVSLLIIGLSGALYFCCKWCKKSSHVSRSVWVTKESRLLRVPHRRPLHPPLAKTKQDFSQFSK